LQREWLSTLDVKIPVDICWAFLTSQFVIEVRTKFSL
jgi:hypothetical protein